ncbi:MAG: cyclic nucleotide-binding protein [Saprospiraceae bacterium]|nr:MAG: cyclic nucleotide-binding protein [Saprospiraceae bacterium]
MFQNFKTYLKTKTGLTDDEFHQLQGVLSSRTFEKGQFLLSKGEVCHHSFFVEQGLLRSYTIDDAGKEHIIQFASEDWFMSDRSSAYFDEPSELFIDAIEDTRVILINQEFYNLAAEISASYRHYNEKLLQNHIRHLQKRINLLLGATAETRYLDFIGLYPDLTLRVPQWMIASYLGITPESLSRVRKELARKNFKGD